MLHGFDAKVGIVAGSWGSGARRSIPGLIAVGLLAAPLAWNAASAQTIELSAVTAGTSPGFAMSGEASGDAAGKSVAAAGDVNGDGLGDLIVSAKYHDGAGTDRGRCYVVFGKTAPAVFDLSVLASGTSTLGFVLNGENDADQAGHSVAGAGDVNGDGLADVIIGAWRADPPAGTGAGRSYVVFGRTATTPINLSDVTAGTAAIGFVINGQTTNDYSGYSVGAAGDVNGDGRGDLIVGAPFRNAPAGTDSGAAYVVFGKSGPGAVQLSSVANPATATGFVINGQALGDNFGMAVDSAGDVNGDGLSDVIIGAPSGDPPGGANAGRSYVVFGKTSSAAINASTVANGSSGLGFAINGENPSDISGRAVAGAGDVNGDGLADVIVGAREADPGGQNSAGRSYVVFGKTSSTNVALSDVSTIPGIGGFAMDGQLSYDRSGASVSSAGDVNGDGRADVLVGAPGSDPDGKPSAGRGYVVFGKTSTTRISLSALNSGTSSLGFPVNGDLASDYAGTTVSAGGDVNGDGLADLIVGAPNAGPGGMTQAGLAYVVFSPYGFAPLAPPTSADYDAFIPSGNADRQGVGTNRIGDDATVFPDSRLWLDFAAGSGTGVGNSSFVTTSLTRNDAGLGGGLVLADVADVRWVVQSTRTSFTNCRVTVRYTDAEIAGLGEGALELYSSGSLAGPFTLTTSFTRDTARNELSGIVTTFPRVFVIVQPESSKPVATITRLLANPTANQLPTWSVGFSQPVGTSFSLADLTPTGSLAGSTLPFSLTGADPNFVVRLATMTETANGTMGFDIPAGAVTSTAGVLGLAATAPAYTVNEVGAGFNGDVNKDSVVNVADVTLLADHIVNGTPLP